MTEKFKIDRLSWQGDGIASVRSDDVYVPYALAGETVEGDISDGICHDVRILEPVADRIKPACRHFKKCGGCSMQHASDALLADWKTRLVRDTLSLNYIETNFRPIKVSGTHSRRRAVFYAKRTKKSSEVGFHKHNSDIVINLLECPLMHPSIMAQFDAYRTLAKIGCSRKTEIRPLHNSGFHLGQDFGIPEQSNSGCLDGPVFT